MPTTLLTRLETTGGDATTELAGLLLPLTEATPHEPGNLSYSVQHVVEEPNVFYILETWTADADADRHARVVEDNGTVAAAIPLLANPITTIHLKELA